LVKLTPGLFNLAPEHSFPGYCDRELPFLTHFDITLLVLARVIGVIFCGVPGFPGFGLCMLRLWGLSTLVKK
jgi:hypothetical protein